MGEKEFHQHMRRWSHDPDEEIMEKAYHEELEEDFKKDREQEKIEEKKENEKHQEDLDRAESAAEHVLAKGEKLESVISKDQKALENEIKTWESMHHDLENKREQ